MKAARDDVYAALDSEREYQEFRWNENTTMPEGEHSIMEWLVFLQDYVTEAMHIATRVPTQLANPQLLDSLRKIGGMCVCAMEQHGAPIRVMKCDHPSKASMEQAPSRTVNRVPTEWRLARREDGELVLQAGYYWLQGNEHGVEWRDRETVDYAAPEPRY